MVNDLAETYSPMTDLNLKDAKFQVDTQEAPVLKALTKLRCGQRALMGNS
jgi:hypothetical protein